VIGAVLFLMPGCGVVAEPDVARCRLHEQKRRAEERRRLRERGDEAALGRTGTRCQRRHCRSVCGGRLYPIVDSVTARVSMECPLCDRQAAGFCRDCPRKLRARQALRCPDCATKHQKQKVRRWYYDNPERAAKNGKRWRKRVLADAVRGPEFLERQRAYQAEYRSGPWWNAYMRSWRSQRREALRAAIEEGRVA
jgi:hypothetical protein